MKVTLIADARSPIARGWIEAVAAGGHEIQVLSTHDFEATTVPGVVQVLPTLPVMMSRWASRFPIPHPREKPGRGALSLMPAGARSMSRGSRRLRAVRLLSETFFAPRVRSLVRQSVRDFQPDLVHALRIPFEGILSAPALRRMKQPFVVSIWGNDLTLFAAASRLYARPTRRVLASAHALHCDCERDVRLAREFGYSGPAAVLPTCGGVNEAVFPGTASPDSGRARLGVDRHQPLIFNPRASRGYTRHDMFIASLPAVLRQFPDAVIVTVGIDRDRALRDYAASLGIGQSVIFLPNQTPRQMAELYAAADVVVSATEHDGTPNSILEAMACGAFPVVNDLEPLREWIDHGRNGFIVELSPSGLSTGMINALHNDALRARAVAYNRELISGKATRAVVHRAISTFYREVVSAGSRRPSEAVH